MQTGNSEAKVMKRMLASERLPRNVQVLLEEESMNTLQNAHNCVSILEQLGVSQTSETKAVHLITSEFHLPRALYIFEAVFTHMAANVELIPRAAPNSCPASRGPGNNINKSTAIERLKGEERMITHYLVQRFLPNHIPNMAIAPLPAERRQRALREVHVLLTIAQESGQEQQEQEQQEQQHGQQEEEQERSKKTPVLDAILAAQGGDYGRLRRFPTYAQALSEIRAGRKTSHWIWYIIPTLNGVRRTSKPHFHLPSIKAAQRYLLHDILADRLVEISTAAMRCMQGGQGRSSITCSMLFGSTDAKKFMETMTFFSVAAIENLRQKHTEEGGVGQGFEQGRGVPGFEQVSRRVSTREQLEIFVAALASATAVTGQQNGGCPPLDADAMRVVCAQTGGLYRRGGLEKGAELETAGDLLRIADPLTPRAGM
jgi:uncharacterized protein (DUF1810 family)